MGGTILPGLLDTINYLKMACIMGIVLESWDLIMRFFPYLKHRISLLACQKLGNAAMTKLIKSPRRIDRLLNFSVTQLLLKSRAFINTVVVLS